MQHALSKAGRLFLAGAAGAFVLRNPVRADLVATVGEILPGTESVLRGHLKELQKTEEGRSILKERPQITAETLAAVALLPPETLGGACYAFLKKHSFNSSERAEASFISDPDLAYIVQRYRDIHDIFHVVTNLTPTFTGEVALKYFEALQTGLPMAVLGATFGTFRLTARQRAALFRDYVPWVERNARSCENLLGVYFERYWQMSLTELRKKLRLEPFRKEF